MVLAPLSAGFQSLPLLPTIKLGPFGAFLSGWACACSRPLWVSPTTSPVRLGVSPVAAPTPTGAFNQRSEALFPQAGALGLLRSPPFILVHLCTSVGPQGLLVVRLLAPFVPHSASLGPTTAARVLSAPVPVSAPPTSLDVCFFFIYLVSDFLAVRFSISSGCARRRSVSTYASILVFLIFQCPYNFWSPIFIYAGISLAVCSVTQMIS